MSGVVVGSRTAVSCLLVLGLAACTPAVAPESTAPEAASSAPAAPTVRPPPVGSALLALSKLPVRGRAAKTGYSREAFGQAWADVDRNGCDTRNDMLRRDLAAVVIKPDSNGCAVLTGTLADPYTGHAIAFRRGAATSSDVQIDHVVALSNAWQTGAAQLDARTREQLANDPLELLAVYGRSNSAKGDGDAATWLPPARGYRCAYVARQVAVKKTYRLWVTAPEKAAIARVLAACPSQALPKPAPAPAITPTAITPTAIAPTTAAPSDPDVFVPSEGYTDCPAARAAHATPLYAGDPGFRDSMDGDGDGVACE